MIGAVAGGVFGGGLALAQAPYPAQMVVTLATLGAIVGNSRSPRAGRAPGDLIVLDALLFLTATIGGWNLATVPGAIVGATLTIAFASCQFMARKE
ncbi:MAG TPA: hypothetical protein VGO31_03315 [Microbacteriaceae bacterium]|jgi:hypothetical protein|nr:hypothetical protein [Microbacteriaceae bacterium]